jgi:hypothetical protein
MFFSVLFACSDSRANIVNQRENVKVKDELSSAFVEEAWNTAMTHSQTAAAEVNLFAIKTPCSLAKLWWDRKPSRWQFRLPIRRFQVSSNKRLEADDILHTNAPTIQIPQFDKLRST